MEKNIQGAWSSMKKFAEGAAAQAQGAYSSAAKGAYDSMQQPTLKATFGRLSDTPLPRSKHTVSVVKGRAYIFGGEVSNGKLADNSMQVVILPSSSGILTTDYKELPARPANKIGAVPAARKGHSACVVANDIYIFGGELEVSKDSEPKGRVWAFDTTFNTWTALDPALNGPAPTLRCNHAVAVSEEPSHKDPQRDPNYLPQQPPDPEQTYNDPPSAFSQGTMFIYGGVAVGGATGDEEDEERENALLSSGWAFSIPSRTWSRLPAPNGPAREKPSMAVVGSKLYLFGGKTAQGPVGGRLEWLEVSGTWSAAAEETQSPGAGNPALWQWEAIDFSSTSGPSPRSSAALVHIITGPGRNQLLLLGGEIPEADDTPTDAWLFTLPAAASSAEPVMGLIRRSTGMKLEDANVNAWIEVERAYADDNSDVIGALKDEVAQRKGFGRRKNMAFAKGTEVDGSTVLVWGGEGMNGRILGDGFMVTIDR